MKRKRALEDNDDEDWIANRSPSRAVSTPSHGLLVALLIIVLNHQGVRDRGKCLPKATRLRATSSYYYCYTTQGDLLIFLKDGASLGEALWLLLAPISDLVCTTEDLGVDASILRIPLMATAVVEGLTYLAPASGYPTPQPEVCELETVDFLNPAAELPLPVLEVAPLRGVLLEDPLRALAGGLWGGPIAQAQDPVRIAHGCQEAEDANKNMVSGHPDWQWLTDPYGIEVTFFYLLTIDRIWAARRAAITESSAEVLTWWMKSARAAGWVVDWDALAYFVFLLIVGLHGCAAAMIAHFAAEENDAFDDVPVGIDVPIKEFRRWIVHADATGILDLETLRNKAWEWQSWLEQLSAAALNGGGQGGPPGPPPPAPPPPGPPPAGLAAAVAGPPVQAVGLAEEEDVTALLDGALLAGGAMDFDAMLGWLPIVDGEMDLVAMLNGAPLLGGEVEAGGAAGGGAIGGHVPVLGEGPFGANYAWDAAALHPAPEVGPPVPEPAEEHMLSEPGAEEQGALLLEELHGALDKEDINIFLDNK